MTKRDRAQFPRQGIESSFTFLAKYAGRFEVERDPLFSGPENSSRRRQQTALYCTHQRRSRLSGTKTTRAEPLEQGLHPEDIWVVLCTDGGNNLGSDGPKSSHTRKSWERVRRRKETTSEGDYLAFNTFSQRCKDLNIVF